MIELNPIFRLVRIVVFGVTSLIGFMAIILGVILITDFYDTTYVNIGGLAIATGVFTLLSLPTMLGFTPMVAVEIGWTWFLWIMWLAVGGFTASYIGSCSSYVRFGSGSLGDSPCTESSDLIALVVFAWIFLMFYNITLVTLTLRQHFRGYPGVWTNNVIEINFSATRVNNVQVDYDPKVSPTYATQYPPVGTPVHIIQH